MNPFYNNTPNNVPNDRLNQLLNNPMYQALRQQGMNPEQMVKYICQQRGIDFEQFVKQIKGNSR